ncbi:hypothetical protein M422DRAFT_241204 [Sphaerobolus stellatus SS14]|nr:hypothetical protein M422DRAFT_241204 [Sphaerobolus stellatus SS14]
MSVIVLGETLPFVKEVKTFGNPGSHNFWVEYPSGLLDLTRSNPPSSATSEPPSKAPEHLEFAVNGDRKLRIDPKKSAIVIVDMQNFFLHPELLDHPGGLKAVDPLVKLVPFLRKAGVRIIWLNWGLTPHELKTIPPVLVRTFSKQGEGGFGHDLRNGWGPALMRDSKNAALYGPLHDEWLKGKEEGTDLWFNKNRVGGLWGPGTAAGLYIQEEGLTTLLFAGVNTDQCVLGTLVDAYFNGYDTILVTDTTATTSPDHGFDNVVYNSHAIYGFATDSERILKSI